MTKTPDDKSKDKKNKGSAKTRAQIKLEKQKKEAKKEKTIINNEDLNEILDIDTIEEIELTDEAKKSTEEEERTVREGEKIEDEDEDEHEDEDGDEDEDEDEDDDDEDEGEEEDLNEIIVTPTNKLKNKRMDDVLQNIRILIMPPPTNEDYEEDYDEDYDEEELEQIALNKKRKLDDLTKTNPNYHLYSKDEKAFYDKLSNTKRKKYGDIEKKTNKISDNLTPMRFKILALEIDNRYKAIALRKTENLNECSSDYNKRKTWIDNFCKIPFGINKKLAVNSKSSKDKISKFLINTQDVLNKNVYGNTSGKEQFLRILAQWISNPKSKGNVIGLKGPPGTGKTVFVKEGISKALGLPFAFIPLGGVNDGAYLTGHSYTYEGSVHSKLIDVLIKAECMNPIIYFDELDKVSRSHRGDEIINTLIHLTDPIQNEKISDKYYSEIDFDFSKSLIIFTYNDETLINPILKDRIISIDIDKYNTNDKVAIAKDYMLPKMLEQYNFKSEEIIFKEKNIEYLITKTQKEDGVRNLKRNIELLLSTINLLKITDNDEKFNSEKLNVKFPVNIDENLISKLIKLKISNPAHHSMYN